MLPDVLLSLGLMTLLVLALHALAGREAPPALPASRLELGWPRGVQEEEPVHFRTERLARHPSRASVVRASIY
jgi:hypothetical protein